jgi:hypothetical protein
MGGRSNEKVKYKKEPLRKGRKSIAWKQKFWFHDLEVKYSLQKRRKRDIFPKKIVSKSKRKLRTFCPDIFKYIKQ